MLNDKSPVPLFKQLANILTQRIESGELKPGDKIMSENELSELYTIGRPTVRQALDLLISKKLIEKRKGSGTYVKQKPKNITLFSLAGTTAAFKEKGIMVIEKIVEPLKKLIENCDEQNPFYNKESYFYSRVTTVDKESVLYEKFYLDIKVFHELEKYNLQGISLSSLIENEYHLKPISGEQTFSVTLASKDLQKILKVDNNFPVLVVRRKINFKNIENAIYSLIYARTDKFVFSQELGVQDE